MLHYRLLEKLGEGSMRVVYKVQDMKLHRLVTLKFLPEYLLREKEAGSRFSHRAKVASVSDHPNITAINKTDEAEGECTRHKEHVERKSIKQLLSVTGNSQADP